MVKRKKKVTSKKKKKSPELLSSLRKIVLWSIVLLATVFAVLYLYDLQHSEKSVALNKNKRSERQELSEKTLLPETVTIIPSGAEIPELQSDQKEQIVVHEGYTVSFNPDYKIANWVAYELTAKEANSTKAERDNKFLIDPDIKGGTAENGDYTRTGYDRGHLAPAGDMKWSVKAMRESFYLSNICPQKPLLNRGIWKELEEQVRRWAITDSALLIVTGPVIDSSLKRLGKNRVAIPDTFYKVIVSPYGKKPKGIAFLFANKGYKDTLLESQAVSIDQVEKLTGIDFFSTLPDALQQEIEKNVNKGDWKFN